MVYGVTRVKDSRKKMFREIGIRIWGEGEEKRGFQDKS